MKSLKDLITGASLVGLIIFALLANFGLPWLTYLAGIFAWVAAVRLFNRLPKLAKIQAGLMLFLGLAGLLTGQLLGANTSWWLKALEGNQALLTMLLAVSFLRLIGISTKANTQPPKGKKALWQTLFAVHLFGSVINFSAPLLIGDQLNKKQPLRPVQALALTRGFSLAAHWSPFFASMGLALISAPGASLGAIMPLGVLVALIGLLIAGLLINRHPEVDVSHGISLDWRSLSLPLGLALAVILLSSWLPKLSILSLVSLVALGFTGVILAVQNPASLLPKLSQHVQITLPSMASETLLFLAAGVLAAGLSSALAGLEFSLTFSHFGILEAWLLVVFITGVALVGIHPVISLAILGGLLAPLVDDPNLLAISFLMGWALGISLSPLSGSNLAMQGRYALPAHKFTLWNSGYTLILLVIYFFALQAYGYFYS